MLKKMARDEDHSKFHKIQELQSVWIQSTLKDVLYSKSSLTVKKKPRSKETECSVPSSTLINCIKMAFGWGTATHSGIKVKK